MERALLDLLVVHTSLALAVSDAEGRVTLTTPALERMLEREAAGLTESSAPGALQVRDEHGERLLTPEEMPLARARAGEIVVDALVTHRRVTGDLTYLRCNAAPLREPDGRLRGAIVLVQDVTADQVAAQQQAALRDRLVSTVNHEIRTPLAKVLGYTELLLDSLDDDASQPVRDAVLAAHRGGQELAALADTITQLVDLEAATRVRRRYLDMCGLVDRVVDRHRPAALAAQVDLRVSCPPRLPATIDAPLVERALGEVLVNAVTYSPAGSTVDMEVRQLDGMVEVCVRDRGPGIPEDERERLVQPFERGEAPGQPVNSRGLGLALARTVAAAHGGTLRLDQADQHGLQVRFTLDRHGSGPTPD